MIDLHISLDEKVTQSSLAMLRKNFPAENNPYLIIGNRYGYDYSAFENVYRVEESLRGTMEMLRLIRKADRVHARGLFYIPLMLVLAVSKAIGKKTNWCIWGHDLYDLMDSHPTIPLRILAALRKRAVSNVRYVSTNVWGDYDLLKKVMGREYEFFKLRFGPAQMDGVLQHLQDPAVVAARRDGTVRILLGNSATVTNCHMQALEELSRFKDENIEIYIPLSYGNSEYGKQVGEKARELFGDKAIPIYDFMDRDQYHALLAKMDIAVFAHNRQQAIGNMLPLLYAGKKVYIRQSITTWPCLVENYHLDLCAYEDLKLIGFDQFRENRVDVDKQRAMCDGMSDEKKYVEAFGKALISEQTK